MFVPKLGTLTSFEHQHQENLSPQEELAKKISHSVGDQLSGQTESRRGSADLGMREIVQSEGEISEIVKGLYEWFLHIKSQPNFQRPDEKNVVHD